MSEKPPLSQQLLRMMSSTSVEDQKLAFTLLKHTCVGREQEIIDAVSKEIIEYRERLYLPYKGSEDMAKSALFFHLGKFFKTTTVWNGPKNEDQLLKTLKETPIPGELEPIVKNLNLYVLPEFKDEYES